MNDNKLKQLLTKKLVLEHSINGIESKKKKFQEATMLLYKNYQRANDASKTRILQELKTNFKVFEESVKKIHSKAKNYDRN